MSDYFEEISEVIRKHDRKRVPHKFIKHALQVSGFSGAATLHLLNECVSRIPDDLYYLEIGTHQGKTITGAALENRKNLIGVDNFSIDFGLTSQTIKWGLYNTLAKYTQNSNVSIYPMPYLDFIKATVDTYRGKVAVYFYDGSHDLPDQIENLWQIKPMLTDKAIVIIDDTFSKEYGSLDSGVNPSYWETMALCERDDEYNVLRVFEKDVNTESDTLGYWNGLIALQFERKL